MKFSFLNNDNDNDNDFAQLNTAFNGIQYFKYHKQPEMEIYKPIIKSKKCYHKTELKDICIITGVTKIDKNIYELLWNNVEEEGIIKLIYDYLPQKNYKCQNCEKLTDIDNCMFNNLEWGYLNIYCLKCDSLNDK